MCKPNIKNIKNILILHVSVISPWQWKQYQSCLSYGSISSATNIVIYLTNSISRQFFDIIQFYLATNIVKYLGNFISGLFFYIIQLILHHLWEACRHLPQHLPCCLLSRPIKSWFKSRRKYFSSLPQTVAKNLKTSQIICSPSCAASQGCPRRRGREGAGWCPCPACSSCSCTWWRR